MSNTLNLSLHRGFPMFLMKEKDEIRIVHDKMVEIGDKVVIMHRINNENASVESKVTEIIESRPAKGNYGSLEPTWYKLRIGNG